MQNERSVVGGNNEACRLTEKFRKPDDSSVTEVRSYDYN